VLLSSAEFCFSTKGVKTATKEQSTHNFPDFPCIKINNKNVCMLNSDVKYLGVCFLVKVEL